MVFDCQDLIIKIDSDNDLSSYLFVEDQIIHVEYIPEYVDEGLYNMILTIDILNYPNK